MDSFYQRAYAMMSSDKARGAAFDLNQEKDKLRDEYGRNAPVAAVAGFAVWYRPGCASVSLT